jgi:hypothetical protein
MDDKRWVREPGPGQIRGEGKWVEFDGSYHFTWDWLVHTGYLPTHIGAEPPDDAAALRALAQKDQDNG